MDIGGLIKYNHLEYVQHRMVRILGFFLNTMFFFCIMTWDLEYFHNENIMIILPNYYAIS